MLQQRQILCTIQIDLGRRCARRWLGRVWEGLRALQATWTTLRGQVDLLGFPITVRKRSQRSQSKSKIPIFVSPSAHKTPASLAVMYKPTDHNIGTGEPPVDGRPGMAAPREFDLHTQR
jgi:hypothetical protein